jgi:hypothetical protein
MALFTDGGPASIDDMKRYDSACEDLARDAGIDLDAKLSVAAEEIGQEILNFLLFQGGPGNRAGRLSKGLADVVVTPAVRRWHAVRALAALYRDGYSSDVNDRFRAKWQEYERLSKESAEQAFTAGIGLSMAPVPKALMPAIAQADGSNGRTYCSVAVTWVGPNATEGAASDEFRLDLGPDDVVRMTGTAPEVAGWNVYAAPVGSPLSLQNDVPMDINGVWTWPPSGLREGRQLIAAGQPADYFVVERRILPRG